MNLLSFPRPHDRASRLVDLRLDGEELGADDRSWLEAHLQDCEACARMAEDRERLLEVFSELEPLAAPSGFADRVIAAARASGQHPVSNARPPAHRGRWVGAGAFAVAAAAAVAMWVAPKTTDQDLQVGGAVAPMVEVPHFTVRAPSVGGARLRQLVDRLALAHGGRSVATRGAVRVVLPRAELVKVLAELEQQGEIELALTRDLAADEQQVSLQFDLD